MVKKKILNKTKTNSHALFCKIIKAFCKAYRYPNEKCLNYDTPDRLITHFTNLDYRFNIG